MTSQPARYPFTPAGRVAVLAIVLALVGATGIASFVMSSRVETALLALPVAIGLLTRREFWRKAALVFAVLQAAVAFGLGAILLRVAFSPASAPSASPAVAWNPALVSIASAAFISSHSRFYGSPKSDCSSAAFTWHPGPNPGMQRTRFARP